MLLSVHRYGSPKGAAIYPLEAEARGKKPTCRHREIVQTTALSVLRLP